jgi:hypothetical protein
MSARSERHQTSAEKANRSAAGVETTMLAIMRVQRPTVRDVVREKP